MSKEEIFLPLTEEGKPDCERCEYLLDGTIEDGPIYSCQKFEVLQSFYYFADVAENCPFFNYKTSVVAEGVKLLDRRQNNTEPETPADVRTSPDDLPF